MHKDSHFAAAPASAASTAGPSSATSATAPQPSAAQPQSDLPSATAPQPSAAQPQSDLPPAADPALRPTAKSHLDPKIKKRLLFGGVIGGALILTAVAILLLIFLFRADYGASYRVARSLKAYITDLYTGGACADVVDDANSDWVGVKSYAIDIEECKSSTEHNDGLIQKLGDTSGVRKDAAIYAQFDTFQASYYTIFPSVTEITQKLALYEAWHTFVVRSHELVLNAGDQAYEKAAEPLQNSENEVLRAFASDWLVAIRPYREAFAAYNDLADAIDAEIAAEEQANAGKKPSAESLAHQAEVAAARTAALDAALDAALAARDEYSAWLSANTPDLAQIAPLDFSGVGSMYSQFTVLYESISRAYEQHYDETSEDCVKTNDQVHCS